MSLLEYVKKEMNCYFQGKINLLKKNKELLGLIGLGKNVIADASNLTGLIYSSFEQEIIYVNEPEILPNKLNLSIAQFEQLYLECHNYYQKIMALQPEGHWSFSSKNTGHLFLQLVETFKKVDLIYQNSPFSKLDTTKLFIFFHRSGLLEKIDGHNDNTI
jgi:hypothetical protein